MTAARWTLWLLFVGACMEEDEAPPQMTASGYVRIDSPTDVDDFHTTMCTSGVSGS